MKCSMPESISEKAEQYVVPAEHPEKMALAIAIAAIQTARPAPDTIATPRTIFDNGKIVDDQQFESLAVELKRRQAIKIGYWRGMKVHLHLLAAEGEIRIDMNVWREREPGYCSMKPHSGRSVDDLETTLELANTIYSSLLFQARDHSRF